MGYFGPENPQQALNYDGTDCLFLSHYSIAVANNISVINIFWATKWLIFQNFPSGLLARCHSCVKFRADSCPWAPFLLIFKHSKVTGQSNLGKLPFLIIDCVGPFFNWQELLGSMSACNHPFCNSFTQTTAFQHAHWQCLIHPWGSEVINPWLYATWS